MPDTDRASARDLGEELLLGLSILWLVCGLGCLPVDEYQTAPPEKDDIESAITYGFHLARMEKLEAARESFQTAISKAEDLPQGPWRDELLSKAYMARGDFWIERSHPMRAELDYDRAADTAEDAQRDEVMARLTLVARVRGKASDEAHFLSQLTPSGNTRLAQLEKTLFAKSIGAPPLIETPAPKNLAGDLEIIPRSTWQPRNMKSNRNPMVPIFRATIHHSGVGVVHETDRNRVAGLIRNIQRMHQDTRQWADIGYHFIIDPAGRVWQARPLQWQGSHAGGDNNRGNVGVCLLGNFDLQTLNPSQDRSLSLFLELLMERYRFTAESVFPHQKFRVTDCPGNALLKFIAEFKVVRRSHISRIDRLVEEPDQSWDLAAMLRAEGIEFLPSCEEAAEPRYELEWKNPIRELLSPSTSPFDIAIAGERTGASRDL